MNTIYLEENQVPSNLKGSYTGKKFKAIVCESMTIPSDAGLWQEGSRDTYLVIHLTDGKTVEPINHNASPWNESRQDTKINLDPNVAVVQHTIFCGKDSGLTFYVHPLNTFLPKTSAMGELSDHEKMVLEATCSLKSSYGGKDRYEMSLDNAKWSEDKGTNFPSREQWNLAKDSLMEKGLLDKRGAVTVKGRNQRGK